MATKILTLTLIAPNRKLPNSKMRWFALAIALLAVMFLASGSVASQWMGWSLSVVACAFDIEPTSNEQEFVMNRVGFFALLISDPLLL